MIRHMLSLALVLLLASSLAACGRKGYPEEPENAVYPRNYPYTPLPVPAQKAPAASSNDGGTTQPHQPRRTRPSELKPPVDTGSPQ